MVVRNDLCVPTMDINLIPPFILREAGLVLNDTPKIHCDDPSVEDNSLFDEEIGLRKPFTLNETFSMFASHYLTEDEIENAGDYTTIFLTPNSDMWDPYNESYKLNEELFLDRRGNMEIPSIPFQHTLVADADMSAASAGIDNNDISASDIEKVNEPRVTCQDEIISRRKKRMTHDKLQQIVNTEANAEFEFSVAETELENLSSSMEFDMPDHPMT